MFLPGFEELKNFVVGISVRCSRGNNFLEFGWKFGEKFLLDVLPTVLEKSEFVDSVDVVLSVFFGRIGNV